MSIQNVPRLNKIQINNKSLDVINSFSVNHFNIIRATPIQELVLWLSQRYNIGFRQEPLGYASDGSRILGCYIPKNRTIVIDTALENQEHKRNFVLAHELGHLALHRDVQFDGELSIIPDTERNFSETKKALKTDLDFLEWQANYFASCILLPQEMFVAALVVERKKMGINWNGRIYVDDQPVNRNDFFLTLHTMSNIFHVSTTVVSIRLRELNLIEDNRCNYHIGTHIQSYLKDIS